MPDNQATMIGTILGRHRIVEKIGAGGMGEVYRARDERLERDVALKVLRAGALANDDDRRRFRKEALALSKLNHPNIEIVHDFDTQGDVHFLVLEYVAGTTVSDTLAHGPLPEKELLRLATQLVDGLAVAHEQGVVHLDLKPGNLRVTPEGRLKILDFGLARLLAHDAEVGAGGTQTVTAVQAFAGTLPYMSPEQLRGGRVDHRTDLWATGVVLYEMATGRRPFEAALSTALAADIQTESPTPPSRRGTPVSQGLEQVILKCLQKDPNLRYQSARDLLADLHLLAAGVNVGPELHQPASATLEGLAKPIARRRIRWSVVSMVALLLLITAGGVAWLTHAPRQPGARATEGPSPPIIRSLAVLPLNNLSRQPEHEYVMEGLHEALITELSKIGALRVISRTSSVRYRNSNKALPQIARELDVDAIVEGSVLRSGNRLRVTAQLVQADPERHLWADSFDRELTDVLYLTSDVAHAVARGIQVTVTAADTARLGRAAPVNAEAYELYAMGRHQWGQRTLNGYKDAIGSFQKALAKDPGYAAVYAALADAYMLLGEQGGLPQAEARSAAGAAIRKALELDENLADAHASLGMWRFYYEWNWRGAEQAFRRAIELSPGLAAPRQRFGRTLGFVGRFDEALKELQQARELDPLSMVVRSYIGQVYFFSRQYDRAAEYLESTVTIDPNHALVRHNLGELYLAQGRFSEAIEQLKKAVVLSPEPSAHYVAMLGCAYARAARTKEARAVLNQLTSQAERGLVSAFDVASVHAALGEKPAAMSWLERGYAQRDVWLVELKAWPWFDSLLAEPRFRSLLQRVSVPG